MTKHPNYEQAEKDGSVPDFIPKSATDIRHAFNIDTNEVWMYYQFVGSGISETQVTCEQVLTDDAYFRGAPPRFYIWWPWELTGYKYKKKGSNYKFYNCEDDKRLGSLAINNENGEAFYYVTSYRP